MIIPTKGRGFINHGSTLSPLKPLITNPLKIGIFPKEADAYV